ncbi:DUF7168 domain-containing protein [Aeromicrobium alkaliterrae]|uniref:DUF2786 domain-containing protein n=1 Tax=Aeromicrobium alkaliterrae TaxID=302168 RepID=A0ABN2JXM9_9ACTN
MDDQDRTTTYAAEDMVTSWLDAVSPETGQVQVTSQRDDHRGQTTYSPEVEPRFTRPSEVAPFVEKVLERLQAQARQYGSPYRGREQRPVRVIAHAGWKKASYSDGFIRLPARERGGSWALRGFVVLHELAHHLNTGIDGAIIDVHGEGFRATFVQLLEDIGWIQIAEMLREAYAQVGLDRRQGADDGMLEKVGKLLRHAEGASTEAERDAFFSKAQELATAHSIELAVARAAHEQGTADRTPTFESVRLGHRGQQSNVRFIGLILAIARTNDLRCSIRRDNTGVTLYGFASDIEVARMLYVSLVVQMVADADAYIRSGAHRPVHGRTARAAFYTGWTDRIEWRLHEARRAVLALSGVSAEAGTTGAERPGTTALALMAKEVEVDDYYAATAREHGVSGTWRGASDVHDARSASRGQAAADRARLGDQKVISA